MLVFSPKGFKTCHAFSQAAKLDRGERLRRQPAVEAQEASQQTTSQLPKAFSKLLRAHDHRERHPEDQREALEEVHLLFGGAERGAKHGADDETAVQEAVEDLGAI